MHSITAYVDLVCLVKDSMSSCVLSLGVTRDVQEVCADKIISTALRPMTSEPEPMQIGGELRHSAEGRLRRRCICIQAQLTTRCSG